MTDTVMDEEAVKARRPRFHEYLMARGDSDRARGRALGVHGLMIAGYRTGAVLPKMSIVTDPAISDEIRERRAELVRRLALDLAAEYGPPSKAAA